MFGELYLLKCYRLVFKGFQENLSLTLHLSYVAGSWLQETPTGASTVSAIVPAVVSAIWDCLVEEFMAVSTTEKWRSIRWNFPLCCGALDGKHVVLKLLSNNPAI